MLKINSMLACAIIDIGLFILIGWGIYITKTAWPLVGLLFMVKANDSDNDKKPEIKI